MSDTVWIGEAAHGNADVIVTLDDGRAFGFTAFTPEGLRRAIELDGIGCFVCPDLMVLADITEANVLSAIDEMKVSGGIEKYGTVQEGA